MPPNKPRARRVVLGVGYLDHYEDWSLGLRKEASEAWADKIKWPHTKKLPWGKRVRLVAEIIEPRKGRK